MCLRLQRKLWQVCDCERTVTGVWLWRKLWRFGIVKEAMTGVKLWKKLWQVFECKGSCDRCVIVKEALTVCECEASSDRCVTVKEVVTGTLVAVKKLWQGCGYDRSCDCECECEGVWLWRKLWRCVCGRSCDRCVREFNKHRCVLTLARICAHAAWHSSAVCPLTSTFCQSTLFPRAENDILSDLGHCSCNAPKSCSFSSLLHSVKMCQIQPVKMAPPT